MNHFQALLCGVVVLGLLGTACEAKEVKLAPTPVENLPSLSNCATSVAAILEQVATTVCLKDQVTQSQPGEDGTGKSISLGKFTKMTGNVAEYSNGSPCDINPGEKMSSTVTVECGALPSVASVGRNGCQYSITMVSPTACDPAQLAALKADTPSPSPPLPKPSPPKAVSPTRKTLSPPAKAATPVPLPKDKQPLPVVPKTPTPKTTTDPEDATPKTSSPSSRDPPTKPEGETKPAGEDELAAQPVPSTDPSTTSETTSSTTPAAITSQATAQSTEKSIDKSAAKGPNGEPKKEKEKKDELTKDNAVVAAIVIGPMFIVTTMMCWGALFFWRRYKEKNLTEPNSLTDPFATMDNPLRTAKMGGVSAGEAPPLPTAKSTGATNWV